MRGNRRVGLHQRRQTIPVKQRMVWGVAYAIVRISLGFWPDPGWLAPCRGHLFLKRGNNMMKNTKLIDTAEVAKLAGVKTQTIRCYQCRGTLPPVWEYIGNKPLWRLGDIKKWCRERPGIGRPVGS